MGTPILFLTQYPDTPPCYWSMVFVTCGFVGPGLALFFRFNRPANPLASFRLGLAACFLCSLALVATYVVASYSWPVVLQWWRSGARGAWVITIPAAGLVLASWLVVQGAGPHDRTGP